MKLLEQIGQIVLTLIAIAIVGGLIIFAVAGVGAITGIQFIGNILMPTDETGRYKCAGLNSWDGAVCDTEASTGTFGLSGFSSFLAGTGLLVALIVICMVVAFGVANVLGQKAGGKHALLLTIVEAPLIIAPTAWLVSTYRHNWLMIALSAIIALVGLVAAYSTNEDPVPSKEKSAELKRYAVSKDSEIRRKVETALSDMEQAKTPDPVIPADYVATVTNLSRN